MLGFLRKIRRGLLAENKLTRYLVYAVGEIFLVVIGILIALQINTWNEQRKSARLLRTYYAQILQDLAKDAPYVSARLRTLRTNLTAYRTYAEALPTRTTPAEIVRSSEALSYDFDYLQFTANTTETLQRTGDIKLLPIDIRNQLIDLQHEQAYVIKTTYTNNRLFVEELLDAAKLGYAQQDLLGFDPAAPLYESLRIAEHQPEIALTVNSAFYIKDLTERGEYKSLQRIRQLTDALFAEINARLGAPYQSLRDVTGAPRLLEELVEAGRSVKEIVAVVREQDRADPTYDISEAYLNALGYYYLREAKTPADALQIFALNIELYPDAYNTYDSYGECLLALGREAEAIVAYERALALNPDHEGAAQVLAGLRAAGE